MKKWLTGTGLAVLLGGMRVFSAFAEDGTIERAGWSSLTEYTASWTKIKDAAEYQLNLYRNEDFVRTVKVKTNKADLSEYMTKEGTYSYEVRVKTQESSGGLWFSQYARSEALEVTDLGDTEGTWKNYKTGKKYLKEDDTFAAGEWYKILGKWYYFDETSHMVTGWKQFGSTWYYMDANGVMQTGWQEVDGMWYYMNSDGVMQTGWIQVTPGQWYYFHENGTMAVNTVIDGYAVNDKGIWVAD